MSKKKLQINQLEQKLKQLSSLKDTPMPPIGWIKTIRLALGISLQQVATKLGVSVPSLHLMEKREKEGSITIKSLRQVAKALDMQLVYGFVPNDGSLDALIERKAQQLAQQIVQRTATTMQLEDQANSDARIKKAIAERTTLLKNEIPKILWD